MPRLISFPCVVVLLVAALSASCSAQGSISDDVGNILSSIRNVVGNLEDFVGDRNGCKFECKNGAKPKPRPYYTPTSNGCGAFGIKLEDHIAIKGVTKCCDEHDFCYDTCNNDKDTCDRVFKKCLQRICKKVKGMLTDNVYEGCKSTADLLFAGTVALGCKPYKDSQEKACVCKGGFANRSDL
ncbi:group XIIA secretory phospholipase A2 [Aplysia californica]|uniref:Group XIIA secretory phospholipase A2 n=1 Tax=Aplysia californica TaxID=6500 RepID=A0ABM0JLQ9_APLCA|nr:group XIIA secretory phospholipase A2 [Aplysia californica]